MSRARAIRQRLNELAVIEGEREALDARQKEAESELLGALCEYLPAGTNVTAEGLQLSHSDCTAESNPSKRCVFSEDRGDECLFCGAPAELETE